MKFFLVKRIFICKTKFCFFSKLKKTFKNDYANNINTWPFFQAEMLIVNLAVGGSWGGAKGIDDRIFPAK